ncbi:hypothetical protein HA466_0314880 [Hirschfeldia incana]|nr:hypothetical protein HA466_0314880 [Hirschfeldia incana]
MTTISRSRITIARRSCHHHRLSSSFFLFLPDGEARKLGGGGAESGIISLHFLSSSSILSSPRIQRTKMGSVHHKWWS